LHVLKILPPLTPQLNNFYVELDEIRSFSITSFLDQESVKDSSLGSGRQDDRKIQSVRSRRSNDLDIYYVVNYRPAGFAIISADRRTVPILAYSNLKNLNLDQADYNPGFKLWSNSIIDKIQQLRIKGAHQDPNISTLWDRIENTVEMDPVPNDDDWGGPGSGCTESDVTVRPFNQFVEWGQGNGYNDECPFNNCVNPPNGRCPTGCVATAIGQIMMYYQDNPNYNWAGMFLGQGSGPTSELLADIGDFVYMIYTCDFSLALNINAKNALVNDLGYPTSIKTNFQISKVKNDLNYGRLV